MLIEQGGDGFDLDDDPIVANEVRGERLNKSAPAILQSLRRLRLKWNPVQLKLDLQTLVINRLEKPAALILVNGKTRADDGVALVFVYQLHICSFRAIRVFRGLNCYRGSRLLKRTTPIVATRTRTPMI